MSEIQEEIKCPGDLVRKLLADRGWTQDDLARVIQRSRQSINDIISGRSGITPETAIALAAAFGNNPMDWWQLEGEFRISQLQSPASDIEKRSSILDIAPIKEMQKRGWLSQHKDIGELESELKLFFGTDDLESDFDIQVSYRRTIKQSQINKAEKAWTVRAIQLAKQLPVPPFQEHKLDALQRTLRNLAAKSKAVHRVPSLLFDYGIRYVVVEPLTNVKIDGAALWLDERSPVIAMSIRTDNVGSFWFTLMHEFMHIKYRDAFSIDLDMDNTDAELNASEKRANQEAADMLVPQSELKSFIDRVAPYFSELRINNLATRLQIHPGIIVGQLQKRKAIGYNTHHKLMAKVRDLATETAFTDGWGRPIPKIKLERM
jgi:HTH-type transcriptional regulator / antitoxin HigA